MIITIVESVSYVKKDRINRVLMSKCFTISLNAVTSYRSLLYIEKASIFFVSVSGIFTILSLVQNMITRGKSAIYFLKTVM